MCPARRSHFDETLLRVTVGFHDPCHHLSYGPCSWPAHLERAVLATAGTAPGLPDPPAIESILVCGGMCRGSTVGQAWL